MYDPTLRASLVRLASSLPAGSPARASLVAHLKVADMAFDIWARVQVLGGAFKVPPAQLTRGRPLGMLQDLAGRLPPDARAAWVNNRTDFKLYEKLNAGVRQVIPEPRAFKVEGKALTTEGQIHPNEVVNNLSAGMTLSGQETESLFYQLGKSKRDAITGGAYLPDDAAKDIFYNSRRRAKDFFKKKDVLRESEDFDSGGSEDEGLNYSEMLTESGAADLVSVMFDTAQGRAVLQKIDRLIDFTGAEQQRLVWDALKENPALIDSNVGLAQAYLERSGKTITPQGVGQLKNKVLTRLAQTVADHSELVGEKDLLMELSSLRRASKKKRLAALLRKADLAIVKYAYDADMLKEALGLMQDLDTAAQDLVEVLDARPGGEGSISDAFGSAADLSRWLRGPMSKEFDAHDKAFRAQARGKSAARYPRDPYWMTAKYSGKDKNGKPFRAGERVFYYPLTKTVLTGAEAEAAARDFDAARFDEDGY
jgi:hypothetical protein